MSSSVVEKISECYIKPKYEVEEAKHPYHLNPWGLSSLSQQYMQNGILFAKPKLHSIENLLESLKESLSLTLVYFYPLAGQFTTKVNEDLHECLVFVDCNKGPGAKFIHASSRVSISDILSPTYVPLVVQSFFDLNDVINHDAHILPLLSTQVTELLDGIFIGFSMNHALADGTSFSHFANTWSEIHKATMNAKQICISHPPIHNCLSQGHLCREKPLPFTHPDEFIIGYEVPQLKERIFHFSPKSMARLKEKANRESNVWKISSFQALTALMWRSIVRANRLPYDQVTNCGIAINDRHRLDPPLPQTYFGNMVNVMKVTSTVKELLEHNLGRAALLVHQSVANRSAKDTHDSLKEWLDSPVIYDLGMYAQTFSVTMTNSPRFDSYRLEFGIGNPLAIRSGPTNKFAGNLAMYPGYEGGGSMDLEVYLPPDIMTTLECDEEFMSAVSLPCTLAKEKPCTKKYLSKI